MLYMTQICHSRVTRALIFYPKCELFEEKVLSFFWLSGLFACVPSFHLLNASHFFKDVYLKNLTSNESQKLKCNNSLVDKIVRRCQLPTFFTLLWEWCLGYLCILADIMELFLST